MGSLKGLPPTREQKGMSVGRRFRPVPVLALGMGIGVSWDLPS